MSEQATMSNDNTSIEAVQQIESLIYRLKKELTQKEKFISNLECKLSGYYAVNKNKQTQSLQQKLKELNDSMTEITNNRKLMRDEIAGMEVNITTQKHKECEVLSLIHNKTKEYNSEMLHIKKDKLNTITNKKVKIEKELKLKEAQLTAINDELKQRDETDLNNLNLLLKKAKLLEMELNDPNYYNIDDRLRIARNNSSESNQNVEITEINTIKNEMIHKRKLKFENEQKQRRGSVSFLSRQMMAKLLEAEEENEEQKADFKLKLLKLEKK
eukprot:506099_1